MNVPGDNTRDQLGPLDGNVVDAVLKPDSLAVRPAGLARLSLPIRHEAFASFPKPGLVKLFVICDIVPLVLNSDSVECRFYRASSAKPGSLDRVGPVEGPDAEGGKWSGSTSRS